MKEATVTHRCHKWNLKKPLSLLEVKNVQKCYFRRKFDHIFYGLGLYVDLYSTFQLRGILGKHSTISNECEDIICSPKPYLSEAFILKPFSFLSNISMISVALCLEFFIIIINHSSKTVSRIFRIYNILIKTNKMVCLIGVY